MAHRTLPTVVPLFSSLPQRGLRQAGSLLAASLSSDCPLCQGPARGGRLCTECETDVCAGMQDEPRCERCALPRLFLGDAAGCGCPLEHAPFARTVAAFDYAPPADMLVLQLKNRMRLSQARALAALMATRVRAAGLDAQPGWVLVPVPASRRSLSRRGFNPAAEIAAGLSRELGWPLRSGWLSRARDSQDAVKQSRLNRRGRELAAEGAYQASAGASGYRIALVDDVMTTGSTAQAAAHALLEAGAREVAVIVAARTPRPGTIGTLAK